MSFVFLTEDFYKNWEFSTFWSDIGLFEAYFVPLLNGGKFFLFAYIFEKLGITPLPFVAFYICDLRYSFYNLKRSLYLIKP